jgi:hypothetical protein
MVFGHSQTEPGTPNPRVRLKEGTLELGFRRPPGSLEELEDKFEGELDLPLRDRRSNQEAGSPTLNLRRGERCSRGIKDVGIPVPRTWNREISVVENVEDLHPELHVKVLRDPSNVVVLEHGKVQISDSGAD